MAVIRHGPAPEDHYSMVSNELARDPNISLQAKGIYLYLRSHREGWAMSTERIGEALGVHRNTVGKYVTELSEAGYLIKDQAKDELGKFAGSDYVLMSSPVAQKSGNGQPCTNSRAAGFTGSGDIVQHKKTNSFKKNNDLKEEQGASRISEDFYPKNFDALSKKYPSLDLDSVLEEFKTYWLSNTTAKAKKKDWDRTFAVWCSRQKSKKMTREQKSEQMRKWKEEILAESQSEEKEEVPF